MPRTRILYELQQIENYPPDGISIQALTLLKWKATIVPEPNTPYFPGKFVISIKLQEMYPFKQPKMHFQTKIYHPNINSRGDISVDFLYELCCGVSFSPAIRIQRILLQIRHLLSEPYTNDPLMPQIAAEYKTNRSLFNQKARQWTEKYAQ